MLSVIQPAKTRDQIRQEYAAKRRDLDAEMTKQLQRIEEEYRERFEGIDADEKFTLDAFKEKIRD